MLCSDILAQSNDPIVADVDILKDPNSPAAAILGIASSDIPRLSDPTSFMMSLRQATDNFTQIPVNYAIDISPIWLLAPNKIKVKHFLDNNPIHNIPQSLVVSVGFNNDDVQNSELQTIPNTSLGFGFKFSVLRGNISNNTKAAIQKSIELSRKRNTNKNIIVDSLFNASTDYQRINAALTSADSTTREMLKTQLSLLTSQINAKAEEEMTSYDAQFAQITQSLDFTRTGLKIDMDAAMAVAFPNRVYDEGSVNKVGAWLTAGYETQGGFSTLGIVRYLYNPEASYLDDNQVMFEADLSLLQAGLRLLYNKNNFSFSFEILSQNTLNNDDLSATYKYLINTEYQLVDNTKLSLTFGKDYDGMISKSGNVISALSFLTGLGSKRTIDDPGE